MALVLTSGPALEPISLAEAKAHLRIDGTFEDALIQSLIITSRLHIEAALGLALITQGWSLYLDRWPRSARIVIPMRPVSAISAVRLWTMGDTSESVPTSNLLLDNHSASARILWRGASPPPEPLRPVNGIEIAMALGFGATPADVPPTIRHALLLLVAHWYENREPVEIGATSTAIPSMVAELLAPHRGRRL